MNQSNPGVYIHEEASGVRAIAGSSTSRAAFVGVPGSGSGLRVVSSFREYETHYGALASDCPLAYGVWQYFGNGGGEALVSPAAGASDAELKAAIDALARSDGFNLLCILSGSFGADVSKGVWDHAAGICAQARAVRLVDPPQSWSREDQVRVADHIAKDALTAVYFPRIQAPDPKRGGLLRSFAPGPAVAGAIARMDSQRGIWKAAAGTEALLNVATGLSVDLTEAEIGRLNARGVNCLRSLPGRGPVIWGARTAYGEDVRGSEWKYLPVRRLALYVEQALLDGTRWAVFEPNDQPLWDQLRTSATAFMDGLFRDGAFAGSKASEAFFVDCGPNTTSPDDVRAGRVNLMIGFAPLHPAEFIVITVSQINQSA